MFGNNNQTTTTTPRTGFFGSGPRTTRPTRAERRANRSGNTGIFGTRRDAATTQRTGLFGRRTADPNQKRHHFGRDALLGAGAVGVVGEAEHHHHNKKRRERAALRGNNNANVAAAPIHNGNVMGGQSTYAGNNVPPTRSNGNVSTPSRGKADTVRFAGKVEHMFGTLFHSRRMQAKGAMKEQRGQALTMQAQELDTAARLEAEARNRRSTAVAYGADANHAQLGGVNAATHGSY